MNILIDTNVLLRLRDQDNPQHKDCIAAIDVLKSRNDLLFICAQVITEFWVVATRPAEVNGMGLDIIDAKFELTNIKESFPCLIEPPDIADLWEKVVVCNNVIGKQAHDARLVALMLFHGISNILTLNPGDFTRYSGVTSITPQEVVLK